MNQSLRKHVVKRTLLLWGRCAEIIVLTTIGICIFYLLLTGIDTNSGVEGCVNYARMMSLMFAAIMQISYGSWYVSLEISFGATRKETLMGLQVMNLLIFLQYFLINFAGIGILKGFGNISAGDIQILVGSLLLAIGIGQLSNAVAVRFSGKIMLRVWMFIAIIFVILVGSIALIFLNYSFGGEPATNQIFSLQKILGLGLLIAGIVIYLISILVMKHSIRNYEVKR